MPFPKQKIRFCIPTGTSMRESRVVAPDSGIVTIKLVRCNEPLPSAENFDVPNLVAAGVTLKEVNTSVIKPDFSSVRLSVESIAEQVLKSSESSDDSSTNQSSNNKE